MIEEPVAIVTGGAKGIGAACCRALAAQGFFVGIHYRYSEEAAQQLLAELPQAQLFRADLADEKDVEAMVGRSGNG